MVTRKKRSSARQKQKKIRRSYIAYGIAAIIILLAVINAVAIWQMFQPEKDDIPQEFNISYLEKSQYKDIDTKFIDRSNARRAIKIEYPVTKYNKINHFIADAINHDRAKFKDEINKLPQPKTRYTLRISYQVPYAQDSTLSVVVSGLQDIHGAHFENLTHAWTFDTEIQKPLTLKTITEDNESSIKGILGVATSKVKDKLKKDDIELSKDFLDDTIVPDNIQYFTKTDPDTLTFHFGRGNITPESTGLITVDIKIDEIKKFLQNDTARTYFNVPKPPKPKPKPAKPRAPAPQPSANKDCANCVAITYDDGPGPYTAELLDTLDAHNVKASFIVIGQNVEKYPSLVKREVDSGMTVINHSWDHPDFTTLNEAQQESQITRANNAVRNASGITPKFIRFPYGTYNKTTVNILKKHGMSGALWNVDTRDWADRNSSLVCNRAVTNAQGGSIILMHDIHPTSVNAAPCVIEGLQERGFKLVTVDRLLRGAQPGEIYFSGL